LLSNRIPTTKSARGGKAILDIKKADPGYDKGVAIFTVTGGA
jgi:hypothetical protein